MEDNTEIQNQVADAMQCVYLTSYRQSSTLQQLEKKLLAFISDKKNREINLTEIQNFIKNEKSCDNYSIWLCFGFLYVKSVRDLRIFLDLAVELNISCGSMERLINKKFYCLCGKDKQTNSYDNKDIYTTVDNLLEDDEHQLHIKGWKAFLNFVFNPQSNVSITESAFFEYVFNKFKAKLDSEGVNRPVKMLYFHKLLVTTNLFDKNVIKKPTSQKNICDDYVRWFEQYLAKSLNKSDLNLIFSVVLTLKNELKSYEWDKLKDLPWIVQFAAFCAKLEVGVEVKLNLKQQTRIESIDENDLFCLSRSDNVPQWDLGFDSYNKTDDYAVSDELY